MAPRESPEKSIPNLSIVDPARDITVIEGTPIDYLDFASPERTVSEKWPRLGLPGDGTPTWR